MSFVSKCPPRWKWIISFYGKVVTIIMYFIVTTYRNKNGNVCCDCVRYYRNDLCWIRVRIVTLNGNKIRWRSYVTYATKLQNDLWLTIVTKIQLYKIVIVIMIYWYSAVREHCSLTALYQKKLAKKHMMERGGYCVCCARVPLPHLPVLSLIT